MNVSTHLSKLALLILIALPAGCAAGDDPVAPPSCAGDDCSAVTGVGDVDIDGEIVPTDADDCTPDACANGGICVDGVASFTCECTGTGYQGPTCSDDVNECTTDNGGCGDPSLWTCFNQLGGALCSKIPQLVEVASYPLPEGARGGGDVEVSGDRLYLIADTEHYGLLEIYDASEPTALQLLASQDGESCSGCFGWYPSQLALHGTTLIVGSDVRVAGFEVSADAFANRFEIEGNSMGRLKVRDDMVYWTKQMAGTWRFAVSGGGASAVRAYTDELGDGYPYDSDGNNAAAFLADADDGLFIWSEETGASLAVIPGNFYRVEVTDTHAFVSDGWNTYVYDVSAPATPVAVAAIQHGTVNGLLHVEDDVLYISGSSGDSLVAYDVSSPAAPSRITSLPAATLEGDVELARQGDTIYVVDDMALRVYTAWGF